MNSLHGGTAVQSRCDVGGVMLGVLCSRGVICGVMLGVSVQSWCTAWVAELWLVDGWFWVPEVGVVQVSMWACGRPMDHSWHVGGQ